MDNGCRISELSAGNAGILALVVLLNKGIFFKLKIKDDFQSVLRTFESLFTTFVLFHVRRHKM